MKKILLGTTAIVGVALVAGQAMAADGPELSVSGYAKFEIEFNDQDDNTGTGGAFNRGYNFEVDDWEIDWKAKAVADNGLEYGAKLEFQFGRNSDDVTDESMIWLSGNWGLINLGDEDGAEDLMAVAGYSVIGGMGAWDGENAFTNPAAASALLTSAMGGDTGDATKITYFTPSFSGFRAGVSWTPDYGQRGNSGLADEGTNAENGIALAAEYKGSFSDVGVHGSVRYTNADYESNDADGVASRERNEISAWAVGAKVTYAGFALAGSYNDNGDSGVTKANEAAGADAGSWWDVALSYSTGPYKVGVGYFSSSIDNNNGGTIQDASVDYFAVTGGWNAAPGLDFYAEYDYVEIDDGTTATANDNEANVFMVGTKVSF